MVGRYSKANDRRSKRKHRELRDQLDQSAKTGDYEKPAREDCDTEDPLVLAVSETTRLYVKLWFIDGQLVDFVMFHFTQLEPTDDGWYMLSRIDCCHSVAHIHFDDDGANKRNIDDFFTLNRVNDVLPAYDEAYSRLDRHWEDRERRFQDALSHGDQRPRPTRRLPAHDFPWSSYAEDNG